MRMNNLAVIQNPGLVVNKLRLMIWKDLGYKEDIKSSSSNKIDVKIVGLRTNIPKSYLFGRHETGIILGSIQNEMKCSRDGIRFKGVQWSK